MNGKVYFVVDNHTDMMLCRDGLFRRHVLFGTYPSCLKLYKKEGWAHRVAKYTYGLTDYEVRSVERHQEIKGDGTVVSTLPAPKAAPEGVQDSGERLVFRLVLGKWRATAMDSGRRYLQGVDICICSSLARLVERPPESTGFEMTRYESEAPEGAVRLRADSDAIDAAILIGCKRVPVYTSFYVWLFRGFARPDVAAVFVTMNWILEDGTRVPAKLKEL